MSSRRMMLRSQGVNLKYNILSYYDFNGNSNDFFNINNGTDFSVTYSFDGLIDNAVNFAGASSSYINLGNNASLNFVDPQPFSILFWVYLNATGNYTFIGKSDRSVVPAPANWWIASYLNNVRAFVYDANTNNFQERRYAINPSAGVWHHVAMVYDPSVSVLPDIYFNGLLTGASSSGGTFVGIESTIQDVRVGYNGSAFPAPLNGKICELAFLNEAIPQTDVNEIMTENLAGKKIIEIF